jgi:lysyl-tRNA synthetase class 2
MQPDPDASPSAPTGRADDHRAAVAGVTDRPIAVWLSAACVAVLGALLLASGVREWATQPAATHLLMRARLVHTARCVFGVSLLVLARGLVNRRWLAHRTVVLLLFTSAIGAALGPSRDIAGVVVSLALAVGLIAIAHHFPTQPDPSRLRTVVGSAVTVVGGTIVLASAWLLWRNPDLHHRAGPGRAVRATIAGMAGSGNPMRQVTDGGQHMVDILALIAAVTLLITLVVLLAPHRPPQPAPPATRDRVKGLADLPDADTLAPFASRCDKDYVFSADGRAAVGYRVLFGVALVGGDPVGYVDAHEAAIDAFLARCLAAGWRPAVIGARGDRQDLWTRRGFHTIGVGDEVVVDTDGFRLDTPKMRNVRQAVKRSKNFGVGTTIVHEGDLRPDERDELAAVAAVCWDGQGERGFSMNLDGLLAGAHPSTLIVYCRDRSGTVVGLQRYAVCAAGRILSLDTMCRVPDAPNGVNERMIVEAIEWGSGNGVEQVSLNFAAFRELFENEERSMLERVSYWGAHRLDRFIKVESLYRFNAKFRPRWVPRSVVLRSWTDVGWVLTAALGAEFGAPFDPRRAAEPELVSATNHGTPAS